MTFLVDADLPRSAADVVRRHGYHAVDVRDIGLRQADDSEIARHAQREQQCLVTGDFDCADIRNSPPQHYAGIYNPATKPLEIVRIVHGAQDLPRLLS